MKQSASLLALVVVLGAPVLAQPSLDYAKFPVYNLTMDDLTSDYAKQKFPPVKLVFPKVAQPVATPQTKSRPFFKAVQYVKAMGSKLKPPQVQVVLNAATDDFKISDDEAQVVELLKNATPFTLTFIGEDATFKPSPISLTPKPEAESIERLQTAQEKGIELETHQVMSKKLLGAENFIEWVKLFNGGEKDRNLALAILRRRFLVSAFSSNYGNDYSPVRNTVSEIDGWVLDVPFENRKAVETAIFQDLVTSNNSLGDVYKAPDAAMVALIP